MICHLVLLCALCYNAIGSHRLSPSSVAGVHVRNIIEGLTHPPARRGVRTSGVRPGGRMCNAKEPRDSAGNLGATAKGGWVFYNTFSGTESGHDNNFLE